MKDINSEDILESLPNEWTFLAEGGAHIVFRYIGQNPTLTGLVLRVAKTAYQHEQANKVASWLFPPEFMDIPTYFHVSEALIARLLERHVDSREAKRLSVLQTVPPSLVSLMPDYHCAKGPGFHSIEIKPKYSCCLSMVDDDPPFNSPQHHALCRFCNHNYTCSEVTSAHERYCPSLLFSEDPTFIRRAILSLCKAPRNNFRLFNNGQPVSTSLLKESLLQQIVNYVCDGPPIRELSRRLEGAWHKVLLSAHYSDKDLMQAVILRDCSIILHDVHIDEGLSNIHAHLIDFDPKPGIIHGKYTKEVEDLRKRMQSFNMKPSADSKHSLQGSQSRQG